MATRRYHKKRVSKHSRKSRKVGRKSRRVRKMKGGGIYTLKDNKYNVIEKDQINWESLKDAKFYNGDELLYKINTDHDKIDWTFENLNKGALGITKTNIKNFLKSKLLRIYEYRDELDAELSTFIDEQFKNIENTLKVTISNEKLTFNTSEFNYTKLPNLNIPERMVEYYKNLVEEDSRRLALKRWTGI